MQLEKGIFSKRARWREEINPKYGTSCHFEMSPVVILGLSKYLRTIEKHMFDVVKSNFEVWLR